ncbi:MAG: restriction endonuclease subunit S, partial [Oligosphaeraceae bacterium]
MNWKTRKLSDCCISIADGDHQPPPKAQSGVPFVTISDITATNQFDFSHTMYVPQEYYENLDAKRKPQRGDILYSVVGSFGIPVYIKEDSKFVFQRHIAILRPNESVLPQFLYYTMLSRDFYMMADAAAIGAAQRTVSLTALRNMQIAVPSIDTQKKVVDILSAYDALIENNQRQIKLLEEAAQRLYKEWFVDLRFPGHETTPIVDGIPEGWREMYMDDICDSIGG